jgi:serine/threonine-protein kinase
MGHSVREGATIGGKYRVRRLVASGAMADVFEATHVEIGKRVALKLMNRRTAASPECVARFRREARAASVIESEYTVEVYDAGTDPEHGLYIATELLVGEDLETHIARVGVVEEERAAAIAYQVARGLAKIHANGVIHRDLKPGNVFLTARDDGTLLTKVLDFGISIMRDAAQAGTSCNPEDTTLTEVGKTVGTPQYMSPEQIEAFADIDGRADVWSLCALLFEMLVGVPPYAGTKSAIEVMLRILREDVPPLRSLAPHVRPALCAIVDRGLARDRRVRPQAGEIATALLDAFPELGPGTSGCFPSRTFAARAPAEGRRPPETSALDVAPTVPSCPVPSLPPSARFDEEDPVEIFQRGTDCIVRVQG